MATKRLIQGLNAGLETCLHALEHVTVSLSRPLVAKTQVLLNDKGKIMLLLFSKCLHNAYIFGK